MQDRVKGGDLFIVDNSDSDWKVRNYLHDWTELANQIDIATGFFEIGALLALDGQWQKLGKIRILMGDEVSKRTKKAFENAIGNITFKLDSSIEQEKENNDFLHGVPGIVEGLQSGKIVCRVYNKDKFHAKAYITHGKHAVVGSAALVGSSNFTFPGLSENVELHVQIKTEVEELQEWYERYWNQAQDVTLDILKIIERHTREFTPFDVYAKSLQELFRGHEMTATDWELNNSKIYQVLDQYQKDGYHALLKISRQYKSAFLCDGVGLGKTYIGLMLIERLTEFERKRVVLLVPKAAEWPVWGTAINRYMPHIKGDFSNFVIYAHTDLGKKGEYLEKWNRLKGSADVFIIDEAHHFRNPGYVGDDDRSPSRYRILKDILKDKTVFFLTATPINNKLDDLRHMIELFTCDDDRYFAKKNGINSLNGHFRKLNTALKKIIQTTNTDSSDTEVNQVEAEKVLTDDELFRSLVVQRSRAYVKESQSLTSEKSALFPIRQAPQVVEFSFKKTYERLLYLVEKAFDKKIPLFVLAIYYPLHYYKGPDESINAFEEGRQREVVSLIRTQFLKRFESSAEAFKISCENLLLKLLGFVERNSVTKSEKSRLERWKAQHSELLGYVYRDQLELFARKFDREFEREQEADTLIEEMAEDFEELDRSDYKVEDILSETFLDLDQVCEFLNELNNFKPTNDDKLKALIKLLKTDPVLKQHKVILFTEFMTTAKYLVKHLKAAGIDGVDEVHGMTKTDRGDIIIRFSPYYNGSSSSDLLLKNITETRVLVSTDVLSEGLNLQDATRMINYDIHWNPVRLMQRIGRVDRRLNPEIEDQILRDHADQKGIRGTVAFWNFLPPDELDRLLRLYSRVSHKTLNISKIFGIEGKKLLKPDDDYDALKEFNQSYEGTMTSTEKMHSELQQLLLDNPGLEEKLKSMPLKVFSGKKHPSKNAQGVFFCFALPALDTEKQKEGITDASAWTEDVGVTKWYLYDIATEKIWDDPSDIIDLIRSMPDTVRNCTIEKETLSDIRKKVEKHIKNTYLKSTQAPVGVKSILKAWMELS